MVEFRKQIQETELKLEELSPSTAMQITTLQRALNRHYNLGAQLERRGRIEFLLVIVSKLVNFVQKLMK